MTLLEEKHFDAIRENRFADFEDLLDVAAKECAKITFFGGSADGCT